ncbi:MAG: hypothetical protein ACTSWK_16165 [Promethearchaeota archaeon]
MPKILLVTYDLNSPGQNYDDILKSIRKFEHIQLSESSYVIFVKISITKIFKDYFESYLDYNDEFHLIKLTKLYRCYGNPDVEEWLDIRFRRCS